MAIPQTCRMIPKHKFVTLDAIRGVAAIFVVFRHLGDFAGGVQFPHSYLAVDLFFVMSGFVLSAAYDKDLVSRKLSTTNFLKIRAIRLYPLYFLALVISIIGTTFSLVQHPGSLNWLDLLIEVLLGLLLIPSPVPGTSLYPLNGPAWSIFFEVIANGLYAKYRSYLTNKIVLTVLGVSGAVLAAVVYLKNSLDYGFIWSNAFGGLTRVLYSFAAGLLVYRIRINLQFKTQFNNLYTLLVLSVVVMLLGIPFTLYSGFYDLIVVLVVFPILVLAASFVEPAPNAKLEKIFAAMGLTSYAMYILQSPFLWVYTVCFSKFEHPSILLGFVAVVGLFVFSLLLDLYFDQPMRRWLRRKYL